MQPGTPRLNALCLGKKLTGVLIGPPGLTR
jgi:hypothetical protein